MPLVGFSGISAYAIAPLRHGFLHKSERRAMSEPRPPAYCLPGEQSGHVVGLDFRCRRRTRSLAVIRLASVRL